MLKRKIYDNMLSWKEEANGTSALLIEGARRIGKSTVVEEFLWANNNNIYADTIRDAFEKKKPLGDAIHRKIMQTFRTYIAVGGMPQAVSAYVDWKDYKSIDRIKRNIVNLYIKDLEKHDKDDADRAGLVFKSIPEQLSKIECDGKMIMEVVV